MTNKQIIYKNKFVVIISKIDTMLPALFIGYNKDR